MAQDFATSYAEIIKYDKNDDGTITVYGKATSDDLDIDSQICDNDWLNKAMPEWFKSGGNIREQHSSIAAGVATEYETKADGHYINALVVDPTSIKKVEAKVLKGFSIGIKSPRIIRDNKAANGRIIDGQIVEVSLVDRPANPTCQLVLAKSVGGELTLTQVEELVESTDTTKGSQVETKSTFIMEPEEVVTDLIKGDNSDESMYDTDDNGSADCGCDGCVACAKDGGCDAKVCKGCSKAADKSATLGKCLTCGCGQVGQAHGLSTVQIPGNNGGISTTANVSTAVIVTPEQNAGSIKSVEAEEAPVVEEAPAVETVEEAPLELVAEEATETKDILDEKTVSAIIEKAVKSATESVKAEIADLATATKAAEDKALALESELVAAKSAAVSGGPKRTGRVAVTDTNELLIKATEYRLKAAATSDPILAKGYKALEKEYLSKASTPNAE